MSKKIGLVGATGYTGSELVRLLKNHPHVTLSLITSESRAGEKFSDVHPFFQGLVDDTLYTADQVAETELDLLFLALPHGISMQLVERFTGRPLKMIDLSGDFRLDTPETYEAWYGKPHSYPVGFEQAVYGLPELFKEDIRQASLVANPGCFPTAALLALAPLVQAGLTEGNLIVDAKSGVTGAGIKPKEVTHYSNVSDNFKAYGLKKHRHTIEIQDTLERIASRPVTVQFTPHLLPVDRGILATVYAQATGQVNQAGLNELYQHFYQDQPFVRICSAAPAIKDVRASNFCNLYVDYDERTNNVLVISVIDNLVKGAAGQAVQNMNLMFGWEETAGLHQIPLNP